METVNGKEIALKIKAKLKNRVAGMKRQPILAVVIVGNDPVSAKYVAQKEAAAKEIGIEFQKHEFPANTTGEHLISDLIAIQHRCDGVIVQLPLPKQIDTQEVLDEIDPDKDPDCLSSKSLGLIARGVNKITGPTAAAVLEILKSYNIELEGKHVVVVGQGELVGKPLTATLLNHPVTLTICGLGTEKLPDHTKKADILVSGTGQVGLITDAMVKKGAVVIDCGSSIVDGKLKGDVDFDKVSKKASVITPTPGGVGPVTVAKLLENLVTLAEK